MVIKDSLTHTDSVRQCLWFFFPKLNEIFSHFLLNQSLQVSKNSYCTVIPNIDVFYNLLLEITKISCYFRFTIIPLGSSDRLELLKVIHHYYAIDTPLLSIFSKFLSAFNHSFLQTDTRHIISRYASKQFHSISEDHLSLRNKSLLI